MFGVRAREGVVDGKLECGRSGATMIEGQCDFACNGHYNRTPDLG